MLSMIKDHFRIVCLVGAVVGVYCIAAWRLYDLQFTRGQYYAARAASQFQENKKVKIPRGIIYLQDKYGNKIPAATNKTASVIFVVPTEIEDIEEASEVLSAIFHIESSELRRRLSKKNDRYELLTRRGTDAEIAALEQTPVKGVYIESDESRLYPFGTLAAQVIGYVGAGDDGEEIGRYGMESYEEKKLAEAEITLTLDRNIQSQAEDILRSLMQAHSATGGTVIVEEPTTGKILALANEPTFDPNEYAKFNIKNFLNPAVQAIYEPGSIFKVVTMVGALDAGAVTPEKTFYDTGLLEINGAKIQNWDHKSHGTVTMTNVIEESINTGAAFAERQLGNDKFYNYLVDFGFTAKTGINLPGEVVGSLRPLERSVSPVNFATASFGQGVSVTPLALISALSAIANEGVLMRPYITTDHAPKIVRRVVGKDASSAVTKMMTSAVVKAKVAAIEGYDIAGKTGTAQIPDFKNGGYSHDVINTYVGFVPAVRPRAVVLVKLDKPAGAPLAGATVVPAFRELAEFIINYLEIPATKK